MVKKRRKKKRIMFYAKKGEMERTDFDDGSRSISMTQDMQELLEEQEKSFVEKFGREPGPDDPLFFDPDVDTPQPYPEEKFTETIVESMREAGVDERLINAYKKTGLLVTQDNLDLMTPEELEEFEEALKSEKYD